MESKRVSKWWIVWFCLHIILSLLINYAGVKVAAALNLPMWLDSVGTAFSAYIGGPVCGALVGISTNLMFYVAFGDSWIYMIVSMAIGIIVGVAAKRKTLEHLFGVMTVAAMLAIAAVVIALPLNMTFGNDSVGNVWGDAVAGFLREKGLPGFLCLPVGQIYVELLDKTVILLLLFIVVRIHKVIEHLKERKRNQGTEEDADRKEQEEAALLGGKIGSGTAALLLAAALALSGLTAGEARAEETSSTNFNDYVQTIYSSQNGLPCGEANDIAQTNDGILWIGTYAGLYRYNGREFRWMDSFDSVRNVNCLYVDEEGRLWIGTNDNGLSIVINGQVVNVIDQSMGLPANSVRSIIRSADGYYYIGTTSSMQVLTLNYGLKRVNTLSEILYADHIATDGKNHVATVTNGGTLFLLEAGQILSSYQMTDGQTVFKSCAFDSDGTLLAATTGNQIFRFDVSRDWFEPLDMMECGDLKSIKDMTFTDSGELFISADNGIGYFDPNGNFERINTNDFNNSIDNMLVDYQGNLWFTSSRLGLLRMAPSDFRDIYSTAGMDNRVVNTIVQWNGEFYFGTDKGLDAVNRAGKKQVKNELTKQLEGTRIRCMMVDSDNHLWICTYGNGLLEVEPDGTQHLYNNANGSFGNRARVVKQLSDGTILAAGDTGLSFIRNHEIEDTILYAQGKISSMILSITEMPDGRILAGTDGNGIAVLENRKVERMLTRQDGLSSEVILRTVLDEKAGGVFVVTSNGLCYMNADETIRTLDNFPYYNNYDIWIRGTDDLFVMSSAGIYVTDRTELLSGKTDLNYDLLDSRRGLNSSLTANSWTWFNEETGELYLACDTGVFAVNTSMLSGGTKVYRMSVPYARMDGAYHRVDRNSPITVGRGVSRLEMNPEVINYTIQDPYVGYKMEGFDSDWTVMPQNKLGTIIYTNLPSGAYTFHLAVFDNSQENILTERVYSVVKEKELYDDPWFILYILMVPMFAVGWVTWLLVKRREQRIERELAEANRLVEMGKQTVIAIARTVDAKDPRTGGHSRRVAIYSKQMAKEYGLSEKDCQEIEWAANMHDIGKIAIPDKILNKDSRLTDEEYTIMKSHTTRGAEILSDFTLLDHVIEGAEFHHERYDGRGYPKGLKGEDIPLFARIIGVADAFDAMTANRVYRKQMDFGYVLNELEKGRGTQFDATFVDILLRLINNGVIDLNTLYGVKPGEGENAEQKQETGSEARPEAKQETKQETKLETNPEAKQETKPEGKPEAKPETRPEAVNPPAQQPSGGQEWKDGEK